MSEKVDFYLYPRAFVPIIDIIGVISIKNLNGKWKENLILDAFRIIDIAYYFKARFCKETVIPERIEPETYRYVCFSLKFHSMRRMYDFLKCM